MTVRTSSPPCGNTGRTSSWWTSGWRRWTASSATAALQQLERPPQVIVLTTFQADEPVVSALRAGASGFQGHPARRDHQRRPGGGDRRRDHLPVRDAYLLAHFGNSAASQRRQTATQRLAILTDREREVAVAIGSGASTAEVAAALFMGEATVKAPVSRLIAKLDVANRVQIAIFVHDADPS